MQRTSRSVISWKRSNDWDEPSEEPLGHPKMSRMDKTLNIDLQDDHLRRMMSAYEGPQHSVVGMTFSNGHPRYLHAGGQTPDVASENQIFEIGSITKVFTAILLCVLIEEGEVDPHAPVSEMGDVLSDVPVWITPERLVSHTSGLPNLYIPIWKALFQQQLEGPYASFSRTDLLAWLAQWHGKDPEAKLRHGYSNLGFGLLGEAMAIQQGKPFAALLAEKVIDPLGLKDTSGNLDDDQQRRFMQPRSTSGRPVMPWAFEVLAGAGFLRSTAQNLGSFASRIVWSINDPKTALDRAIVRSAKPVFGLGRHGRTRPFAQCSGWIRMKNGRADPPMLFVNGGTAGSTCTLFVCPESERALSVPSNNGAAANLWAITKLWWSNPTKRAFDYLT